MELHALPATELAGLIKGKQVSAAEVVRAAIARVEATDGAIGAFLAVAAPQALARAKAIDKKLAAGEDAGPLAGVPVGVKDNICTAGVATTCASRILAGFVPPHSATAIEKLEAAGAVVLGKLNMDEFAMGSSCESSYFGSSKNPWNLACVPGGSSGGSAAAVAACQVPLALGSDAGGSIRQPAAFCGVVGLKPTYGAVSRYGLVAFASSLEQIGPLARTVDDTTLLFSVLCGPDSTRDATAKDYAFTYDGPLTPHLKNLNIGVPREYIGEGVSGEVRASVAAALKRLEENGATLVDVSLPSTEYACSAYCAISSVEASSNLARYDGVKYGFSAGWGGTPDDLYTATRSQGFGAEVQRRVLLGTYLLSGDDHGAYYRRAKLAQRLIAREFAGAFEACDLLATPAALSTAFRLGERAADPLHMYKGDMCTAPASLAGLPAISLPCGLGAGGLPIGIQLIGPKFSESKLLCAARAYEQSCGGFAVKPLPAKAVGA